jgi:hypothetical protein
MNHRPKEPSSTFAGPPSPLGSGILPRLAIALAACAGLWLTIAWALG